MSVNREVKNLPINGYYMMNFNLEEKLLHQILLRSSSLKDLGLYHGKIGVVVFLYLYSKIKSNSIYEDVANEMLDDVLSVMNKQLVIGLSSGISGIGWSIEFLIQNEHIEGDTLEICEELDSFIMEKDIRRIKDYSLETGLAGILAYVLIHIFGVSKQHDGIYPFDEMFLNDLYLVSQEGINNVVCQRAKQLMSQYICFYQTKELQMDFLHFLMGIVGKIDVIKEKELSIYPIGLKDGLTGWMLDQYRNLITEI